jgi:5-methylthioadenosine/S-adenosylhomocysteine deaminase
MTDLLITNGIVVTMDPQRRVIEGGAVAVAGDRIVEVGDTVALRARHAGAREIDATRHVVMPGLVDGHAHAGHGLVKTLGGGDGDAWYRACHTIYTVGSDEEFWRAEARLSALERLKCGVTTGVSLLGGGDSIYRTDDPRYGFAHADAVDEVGIRAFVAVGPCRPPFPRVYATLDRGERREAMIGFAQHYETIETLLRERHRRKSGRVHFSTSMPVHSDEVDQWTKDNVALVKEQGREIRALGRKYGATFTQDGHKRGSLAIAHEFGLLGPDAYMSHNIDLTERDLAAVRETDTRIVHNPSAVMSIRGRCPVPELIDMGVTVALGSDGTAPDRSFDMFRHMFQCMHYHRRHFRDASILPPGKVIEMTTIDGARALGLEDEIGSLEAGKKADIVLVDMFKPHLYPLNMPLYRLACFANGADVDTVIVDGRVLMRGRRVLSVDEGQVLEAAQAATETMLARTGLGDLTRTPERFWGVSRY